MVVVEKKYIFKTVSGLCDVERRKLSGGGKINEMREDRKSVV